MAPRTVVPWSTSDPVEAQRSRLPGRSSAAGTCRCSVKNRPTRSCSLPMPQLQERRDASSSRAFSIPPVASDETFGLDVERVAGDRPAAIHERNRTPRQVDIQFSAPRMQ